MRLPESLADLFKNYAFETLDDQRHRKLIIKRVLTDGDWDQIMWLFKHYGRATVKAVFLDDYYGLQTLPGSVRSLWETLFVSRPVSEEDDELAKWRCRRTSFEDSEHQ